MSNSLYGNLYGTQFTFDAIYPNRKEMDKQANSDNVFLNRYVLINYGNSQAEFETNLAIDNSKYNPDSSQWDFGVGYDKTVWMKSFDNTQTSEGGYTYIKIANLNSLNFMIIDCGYSNYDSNLNDKLSKSPTIGERESLALLSSL
jgi:PKD repeat protein